MTQPGRPNGTPQAGSYLARLAARVQAGPVLNARRAGTAAVAPALFVEDQAPATVAADPPPRMAARQDGHGDWQAGSAQALGALASRHPTWQAQAAPTQPERAAADEGKLADGRAAGGHAPDHTRGAAASAVAAAAAAVEPPAGTSSGHAHRANLGTAAAMPLQAQGRQQPSFGVEEGATSARANPQPGQPAQPAHGAQPHSPPATRPSTHTNPAPSAAAAAQARAAPATVAQPHSAGVLRTAAWPAALPAPVPQRPPPSPRPGPPPAPQAPPTSLHIGRIQLSVRQPPAPAEPPRSSPRPAAAPPAFSAHRHYLRGL